MNRSVLKGAMVLIASTGLLTMGVAPAVAYDDGDHGGHDSTVDVVGNGTTVDVSEDSIPSGTTSFEVSTTNPTTAEGGGSDITLFTLKDDASLDDFYAGLQEEFSTDPAMAAKGTRDLTAAATFRGLAQVVPDHPVVVTECLESGTYYLMDLGVQPANGKPELTRLEVGGNGDSYDGDDVTSDLVVTTVDDRFLAPDTWPAAGTYTFSNESDTVHFMAIVPVKEGTTDDDVQAAFDNPSTPPDFLVDGPTSGNDVVSPGYDLQLTYDLPAGTYVLLCFVADDETGMPHAVMGMHKVVVLE